MNKWNTQCKPGYSGNFLTYRPDAPPDSQVVTLWYDSFFHGWNGIYPVVAWRKIPARPKYITRSDVKYAEEMLNA